MSRLERDELKTESDPQIDNQARDDTALKGEQESVGSFHNSARQLSWLPHPGSVTS